MKLTAKLILAALVVALVILRADEHVPAPQGIFSSPSAPSTSSGMGGAVRPRDESASPPRVGEMLSYRISWENFATAATASISVRGRADFYGLNVWQLEASLNTVNPVRRLFTIDDKFQSLADFRTLASHHYEMNLQELGKDRMQLFRPAQDGSPPPGDGVIITVPEGTYDPLGALFALRMANWSRPLRAHVFDGKQIYEMAAERGGDEAVTVPAGRFKANRINVQLQPDTGKAPPLALTIWLTLDDSRVPIAIEAALPFGSLRAQLTSATSSR